MVNLFFGNCFNGEAKKMGLLVSVEWPEKRTSRAAESAVEAILRRICFFFFFFWVKTQRQKIYMKKKQLVLECV